MDLLRVLELVHPHLPHPPFLLSFFPAIKKDIKNFTTINSSFKLITN